VTIKVCYAEYNLLNSQTRSSQTLNYETISCSFAVYHSQWSLLCNENFAHGLFSFDCGLICGYQCLGRKCCHCLWKGQWEKQVHPEYLPWPMRLQCHRQNLQGHSQTTQCHT